jgi:hypothetical protein
MRIAMGIAGTLLSFGAMTAQATTYGLDVTIMSGAASYDFDGSFDFSKSGNCTASSLLCAPGAKPDFTNVNVSDGFNNLAFTQASLSSNGNGTQHLTLIDLNGLPDLSSQILKLSFDVNAPLGGPSTHFTLSDIVFAQSSNGSGFFDCSAKNIKCSSSLKSVKMAAPEMDVTSSGGALALLVGSLFVLGGRLSTRYR